MSEFFNTTGESGEVLKEYKATAGSQTGKVLNWFKANPEREITPSEIHFKLFGIRTPLTSTRRSLSVLTKANNLVKCDTMREGKFGRDEHCWKLNNDLSFNDA